MIDPSTARLDSFSGRLRFLRFMLLSTDVSRADKSKTCERNGEHLRQLSSDLCFLLRHVRRAMQYPADLGVFCTHADMCVAQHRRQRRLEHKACSLRAASSSCRAAARDHVRQFTLLLSQITHGTSHLNFSSGCFSFFLHMFACCARTRQEQGVPEQWRPPRRAFWRPLLPPIACSMCCASLAGLRQHVIMCAA